MDPLGPLTNVIRGLWRSRSERTSATQRDPAVGERTVVHPEPVRQRTEEELRERLRAQLAPLASSPAPRRYQVFVETVLLWELSDDASSDPRFTQLVGSVVAELTSDARVSARLNDVLASLTA